MIVLGFSPLEPAMHRIVLPLLQTEAIFDNLDTLKLDNLTQQALESEKLRSRFRSLYSK